MRTHCQACEDKDELIAYLRSEVGIIDDMVEVSDLQRALKLTPTQSRIIRHLYRSRHHTATRLQLAEELRSDDCDPKTVDVILSKIRCQLGHEVIESIWGEGWRLTPEGVALLEHHMNGRCAA